MRSLLRRVSQTHSTRRKHRHRGFAMKNPASVPRTENPAPRIDFDTLPDCALVRRSDLLAPAGPVPWSHMTLHRKVKAGKFPAPVKLAGGPMNYWRWGEVRPLLQAQKEAA